MTTPRALSTTEGVPAPHGHAGRHDARGARALRILLADDHVLFRQGVRTLLKHEGFDIVAEAGDGREAVRLAKETCPDIAILDLSMPQLDGAEAAQEITQLLPSTRTILLTMHASEPYIARALQAGATGYVLKTQSAVDLVRAIDEVMAGRTYLSPGVSQAIAQAWLGRHGAASSPLTARETEVLRYVAEGKTTREVAQLLGISIKTAESHRARIMTKLDIHDTAGLVRYAVRQGLIQP